MIQLQKGNTETIYFTGTEKTTLTNPYFLFIFTNSVTNVEVKFVLTNTSTSTRYDKGTVTVNTYFANEDSGLWYYRVREQASSSNTDEDLSGAIVEEGYMNLIEATIFEPVVYNEQDNEFKTYDIEQE